MKGGDEDSEEAADGEAEMSIVGRRRKGGVVEYLLRWDDGAQTWESAADGAEALMAEYDKQNPWPKPGRKRGAPDLETEEEDAEMEYDVDAVLQRRVTDAGEVQYRVRWSDKSLTWEAQENLEGAEELVTEFEDKRTAARKGPGGRGSSRADKRSGLAMRGAGGADWTGGDAVNGRFEALETGMSRMCESINLMVETQLAQREQVEEEAAVDLTKVPGTRALLKGDKRLREVGFDHFKKEWGLKREKRNSRLPTAMPFSKEYNDVLDQLLDKDAVIMECRLKARQATREKEQQRLEVKAEVLEEEYMALEDELELLQDCVDTAQAGKMQEALQVYADARKEQKVTSRTKELEARHVQARKTMRENATQDQAELIARSLGVSQSAWTGGADGRQEYQHIYRGSGASRPGWGAAVADGKTRPLPAIQAPPPPPAFQSQGKGGDWKGKGGWGSFGDGAGGKGAGRSQGRKRTYFRQAESILGANCPPELQGVFIPDGIKFHRAGKSLRDPPRKRTPDDPFSEMCKMCGNVCGGEAWECVADCMWSGRPAMGARRLYEKFGAAIINEFGEYKRPE